MPAAESISNGSTIVLRQWREDDIAPFAAMNADVDVMQFQGGLLTFEQSAVVFNRLRGEIEERGWGIWAVDVDGEFAGYCGLKKPTFHAHFMPCTEILWRFRREFWGRNIAYRAAGMAIELGFHKLKLPEILAFTSRQNIRSRRLIDRLGFVRDLRGDFEHPLLPKGHCLRPHILYRLRS